ncbi:O-methyltransferase [Tumebacillus permanentifrigoris]|uniref:tRNA 5-hydroxyuridine methyltransferase n=1 Tax=Tumebacillus permanentifrigoris TaxID=378543 RepID=A0A316DPR3_9BACL|nr:O-methyltransferase [Tumebacillus permanentifrigoris]PWK05095.1 putative O-methyltransferase YrrM [Tumebacillus permanentifrigoris]
MIDTQVVEYLRSLVPERDELLQELERRAEELYIPILDVETMGFLRVFLAIAKPKRILEVGSAIGYSAIVMARATQAQLTTIERDPERAQEARQNFARAGLAQRVELLEGDALEIIPLLGEYDLIFLDAAKGQYPRFLELLHPHLLPGGILLSDNVLFQGLVSGDPDVKHKLRTMINRLREYNVLLTQHPDFETSILPVGDGLAVSVRAGS